MDDDQRKQMCTSFDASNITKTSNENCTIIGTNTELVSIC